MVRIHIGHHFYGAGNFGDDLMLAGFLSAIKNEVPHLHLSCSTPHDILSQQKRFPEIEWLPYNPGTRQAIIERCDVWLGLGDTPFQTDVGLWFLKHLEDELSVCKRFHKRMFFLGVGVNDKDSLKEQSSREILEYASHIWTRDRQSAEMLSDVCENEKIEESADLAHAYLASDKSSAVEHDSIGYVLNFDRPEQFYADAFHSLVQRKSTQKQYWILQESRKLSGMESDLFSKLSLTDQSQLQIRSANYSQDSVHNYVEKFGTPEYLLTSRYHACVVGAWKGCKVVAINRNEKIRGLVEQVGFESVDSLSDIGNIENALNESRTIPREKLLLLKESTIKSCLRFLETVS